MPDHITVVVDPGSSDLKAGFGSEHFPRVVIPSVQGRYRNIDVLDAAPVFTFGSEAIKNRGISTLIWPIGNGLIKNWDVMEMLLHHVFYKELMIPPEDARFMMSVHPLMSLTDKARVMEIMFETFYVNEAHLSASPVLSLHATGRTTGIVFESGAESSYVCPIFEGYPLRNAVRSFHVTGSSVRDTLKELLKKLSYSFTVPLEMQFLDELKKKYCYVAQLYPVEVQDLTRNDNKIRHYLPDGQYIQLGPERVQATETIFQTTPDHQNLIDTIQNVINNCDIDYRAEFYKNIVLSGGNCMFNGLTDRLTAELMKKIQNQRNCDVKVDSVKLKQFTPWLGGSILSMLDTFKGFWISKQEYADHGTDHLAHKCY